MQDYGDSTFGSKFNFIGSLEFAYFLSCKQVFYGDSDMQVSHSFIKM